MDMKIILARLPSLQMVAFTSPPPPSKEKHAGVSSVAFRSSPPLPKKDYKRIPASGTDHFVFTSLLIIYDPFLRRPDAPGYPSLMTRKKFRLELELTFARLALCIFVFFFIAQFNLDAEAFGAFQVHHYFLQPADLFT